MLLTNKFRNKYSVNNVTEPDIDRMIRNEISLLLDGGNTYEDRLNHLDKKLEALITDCRKKKASG